MGCPAVPFKGSQLTFLPCTERLCQLIGKGHGELSTGEVIFTKEQLRQILLERTQRNDGNLANFIQLVNQMAWLNLAEDNRDITPEEWTKIDEWNDQVSLSNLAQTYYGPYENGRLYGLTSHQYIVGVSLQDLKAFDDLGPTFEAA